MQLTTVKPNESIVFSNNKIVFYMESGELNSHATSNINKISILTNDTGPIEDDMAIAIFFDKIALVVPSEHPSYDGIYDSISENFAIDYEQVIKSMTCTENAEFILFQRK